MDGYGGKTKDDQTNSQYFYPNPVSVPEPNPAFSLGVVNMNIKKPPNFECETHQACLKSSSKVSIIENPAEVTALVKSNSN